MKVELVGNNQPTQTSSGCKNARVVALHLEKNTIPTVSQHLDLTLESLNPFAQKGVERDGRVLCHFHPVDPRLAEHCLALVQHFGESLVLVCLLLLPLGLLGLVHS